MSTIANLIRPELRDFKQYSSARDEAKNGKVWLNANESPFADSALNRYPEKQPATVIKQLAELYKVDVNQLVLSRGSDEVIDLLIRLFCSAGKDSVMICPPTFGMYSVCAQLQHANILEIPLMIEKDFQLDIDAILQRWDPSVKIIFLCSPNNPTGNIIPKCAWQTLCNYFAGKCIVVIDEAYIEFSHEESAAQYINTYNNLVVLKTLSKAYKLAGARCGILLAQAEIVDWVLKIMAPYPVPAPVTSILEQQLTADSLKQTTAQINLIKKERDRVYYYLLNSRYAMRVWPSAANYLLVQTFDAQEIMDLCKKHNIVIRNMHGKLGLDNCVRVSIGLPEENNQLLDVFNGVSA